MITLAYKQFNPNPMGRDTGDCVVRALSKVLGQSWEQAFVDLIGTSLDLADMPSKNTTWGEHLRRNGFHQKLVGRGPGYTVADFCRDNPQGRYVLAIDGHVVAAENGDWYDSFDSGGMIPVYVWFCPTCEKKNKEEA